MSAPKSIDVEGLIAQTRAGLDHPIPPPWPDAKKVMAFLCDAMEALVGEVRSADRAADALQSRLAAAEAECRAREEVQARLIRERNAAEAEAERARGLTFDALRAVNVPRVAAFGQTLDAWSPMEWACAAAGEMGELCNVLKKRSRKEDPKRPGHDITGKPIPTLRDAADEIADVVIYLDLLGAALGIDMGEAVARKWNEVSKKMGHDAHLASRPEGEVAGG